MQLLFYFLVMEHLRICRCTPTDLAKLRQIAEKTFRDAFEADNDPDDFREYIQSAFSEDRIKESLETPGTSYYFVFNEETLVAYFQVNEWFAQSDLNLKDSLELERIYVAAEYQGKGIGKWILDGVCKMARVRGLRYVWLGVWEKNRGAIDFYKCHGFRKFGEHPYYIGQDRQTDWLMRKEV